MQLFIAIESGINLVKFSKFSYWYLWTPQITKISIWQAKWFSPCNNLSFLNYWPLDCLTAWSKLVQKINEISFSTFLSTNSPKTHYKFHKICQINFLHIHEHKANLHDFYMNAFLPCTFQTPWISVFQFIPPTYINITW